MKRLHAVALAAGVLTASCSGHGGQSALPSAPGMTNANATAHGATAAIAVPSG